MVTIFLKFCTMEGTKRYMELIVMLFQKKISFRANGPFWPENGTSSYLWIHSKSFLKFCINKGAKRYIKITLMVFPKKYHFGKLVILNLEMV